MKNKGSCKFVPVKLKLWSKAAEDKLTLDQKYQARDFNICKSCIVECSRFKNLLFRLQT